ncbi:MAG: ABC transporter ATP-binding protein [Alphaproteobacteria bacterium]|nr:ABC transporter ATP-binding protein [Alphaproteobacteria bacterium]
MNSQPAIVLEDVHRSFSQGPSTLHVLRGANLALARGEIVALVGPSGAGKSTLLHIAGLLEQPDRGRVVIDGIACGAMPDERRTELRRHTLGFVYQFHHLLPEFSAAENVIVPQMIAGRSRSEGMGRARELLSVLGVGERESHRPGQLSGGEQQRVAIARALANRPAVLLADEPTGNLDPDTADGVFAALVSLAKSEGLAALIATHNPSLAARMDRVVRLQHGVLVNGPANGG